MTQEDYILNPENIKLSGVTGDVTTFGAQDAASGDPEKTSWFVGVNNNLLMNTRNRDYANLFSLAIQKHWQVNVGYTDVGRNVFWVRMDG